VISLANVLFPANTVQELPPICYLIVFISRYGHICYPHRVTSIASAIANDHKHG